MGLNSPEFSEVAEMKKRADVDFANFCQRLENRQRETVRVFESHRFRQKLIPTASSL
jgi:hypothetical protein